MDKTIQVEVKHPYGTERIYPVCETSKIFSRLAKTETLSRHDLEAIKKLGYEIQVKQAQYSFQARKKMKGSQ